METTDSFVCSCNAEAIATNLLCVECTHDTLWQEVVIVGHRWNDPDLVSFIMLHV